MVPPRRMLFKEYRGWLHGPLVQCEYDTAAYQSFPPWLRDG